MNCIDLADIHAAALGLPEEQRPDTVQAVIRLRDPDCAETRTAQVESRRRLWKIRAARRHPLYWRGKVSR